MRRNEITRWLVLLLLGAAHAGYAQEVKPSALEYWLDGHYDARQSMAIGGQLSLPIDVSQLGVGLHSIEMRVSDTKGRWSTPLMRYFLKRGASLTDNRLLACTYWIDEDQADAVSSEMTSELSLDIDISQLHQGIHSLKLNINDSQGRLSQTVMRYFLALGEDATIHQLTRYRYWIDHEAQMHQGATTDGSILLDIDVNLLGKGIHTLCYQVEDNTGRLSAPIMRYFLVPDLETGANELVAYEYWFNNGPRRRVELAGKPGKLNPGELLIEVNDVAPDHIRDNYTFNPETETVTFTDDMTMSLQLFNGAGQGSLAVTSDTFSLPLTVHPYPLPLADGESQTFKAPHGGTMHGWKVDCLASDSLTFSLKPAGAKADLFDGLGQKLQASRRNGAEGEAIYAVKSTDTTCYLLIYDASNVVQNMSIALSVISLPSAIQHTTNAWQLTTGHRSLGIVSTESVMVNISSVAGHRVFSTRIGAGRTLIPLSPGVYLVRIGNEQTRKVVVD